MPTFICVLAVLVSTPALAEAGAIAGLVDSFPSKYLRQTVVYLKDAPPPKAVQRHRMDQKGMTFLPHILTIAAGDTVSFANSDGVDHNVLSRNLEPYDLGVFKRGQSREHTFTKPGVYVQQCTVHPEMLAYIFVGPSTHSAVVAQDGTWKITGIPPGKWTVAVWNPALQAADQTVELASKEIVQLKFHLE